MRDQERLMFAQGYITPPEAARRIGMTPVSVVRFIEKNGVETQRAGRWWYINVESLAAAYAEAPAIQTAILSGVPVPAPRGKLKMPPARPKKAAKAPRRKGSSAASSR